MRARILPFILVLIAAFVSGCGGDSVTSTGATAKLSLVVQSAGGPTVQKATLFFDGREVASASAPAGAMQLALESTVTTDMRGPHTLRVVIVQQTASPSAYAVGGGITVHDRILDLAPVQGVLATGQALEMQVSF